MILTIAPDHMTFLPLFRDHIFILVSKRHYSTNNNEKTCAS